MIGICQAKIVYTPGKYHLMVVPGNYPGNEPPISAGGPLFTQDVLSFG